VDSQRFLLGLWERGALPSPLLLQPHLARKKMLRTRPISVILRDPEEISMIKKECQELKSKK